MIIDFRTTNRHVSYSVIINNEPIERVSKYKYLGMIIDDQLKGDANTAMVYKKCNQSYVSRTLLGTVSWAVRTKES